MPPSGFTGEAIAVHARITSYLHDALAHNARSGMNVLVARAWIASRM